MTSALDALVFVKVCNLWWVSDKVPQGRGVAPVQLLSRRTPDSTIRTSDLQTLIGNSSKSFSVGSRFLLAICFITKHCGGLPCFGFGVHDSSWWIIPLWYVYYGMFTRTCLKTVAGLKISFNELCRYRLFKFELSKEKRWKKHHSEALGFRYRCASIRGET